MRHTTGFLGIVCYVLLCICVFPPPVRPQMRPSPAAPRLSGSLRAPQVVSGKRAEPLDDILQYISASWNQLTRSMSSCESLTDVKTDQQPVLYLPADLLSDPPAITELQKNCAVKVEHLPIKITGPNQIDPGKIRNHGLLYLEHPYVVPGGQFNEMYGWDSYFIIRGLLRDNQGELARGMVENFLFEIEHYGGVLNANRTYYLTRSQPPFLTSMILAVYDSEKAAGRNDLAWLERAYRLAAKDYEQWTQKPHLAGDTGLSRYFDHGEGPVPEILSDPSHYYRGVAHFFLLNDKDRDKHLLVIDPAHRPSSLIGAAFPVRICDPPLSRAGSPGAAQPSDVETGECAPADQVALTAEFYKGDRSMRESGFDVTFRFGPFGADTHHYAAVCLNTLLYKTEKDLQQMSVLLGRPADARVWERKALQRRELMVKYLWDARRGMFFDYDFVAGAKSSYDYATTFYPLWAGLASKQEAQAVVRNLPLFEQQGGLAMSRRETQAQWDYPYGWAPVHLIAAEGLRRYGYNADADRLSNKFLETVLVNFRRNHTIREKYDVVASSDITHIQAGYTRNEIGFGWTNGVFLELLHQLPQPAIVGGTGEK
jgi:alpha,alpha-trehalase